MPVRLNFINRSLDVSGSDVLVFQKNVVPSMGETAVAWKVISRCGYECHHPFTYPTTFEVACSDDYGNYSPLVAAEPGQMLSVSPTTYGRRLGVRGVAPGSSEVEVANDLPRGAVNINIFKDGQLLARKTSVAPQQKAVFQFKPTLWIGAVSQVVQGQALSSAVISSVNTELSLLGVNSADIVMTGGGPGLGALPYAFTLENVVMS